MRVPRTSLKAGVLTVLLILAAVTGAPAFAQEDLPFRMPADEPSLQYLQEEYELDADEALLRLELAEEAGRLQSRGFETGRLDVFSGVGLSGTGVGTIEVLATSQEFADEIAASSRHPEHTSAIEVSYSWEELENALAQLAPATATDSRTAMVDFRTNQVDVVVASPADAESIIREGAAYSREGSHQIARVSIDRELDEIPEDSSSASQQPIDCGFGPGNNMRGGHRTVFSGGDISVCSIGFIARDNFGGNYFFTSGHCAPIPNTGSGCRVNSTFCHGAAGIGRTHYSADADAIDARAVSIIDTSRWPLSNWVFRWGFGTQMPITSTTLTSSIGFGQPVCRAGASSPHDCGEVLTVSSSRANNGGYGFVSATYCARPGDSGGAVYRVVPGAGYRAYGLHVSSSTRETDPGTACDPSETAHFTAIRLAEAASQVYVRIQ